MISQGRYRVPSVVILSLLVADLLLPGFPARAETLLVCPEGCAFRSIQEALSRASPGDTIFIQAGTYVENLVIAKQGLLLRGEDPGKVVLRAQFSDEPVILVRESDVRISSLTITGGARGVQIESRGNNATLSNLIVRGNQGEGLFIGGTQAGEARNCLIRENTSGIFVGSRATFRFTGNRIHQNRDGVEALDAERVELRENVITGNSGCGVKADDRSQLLGSNNAVFANGQNLCGSAQGRTSLLDQTPPPPPQNLRVTPADWTNQGRFEIAWEDPEDLAGIAAYYFKLRSAPTSPTDGTRRDIAQKPLVLENPPEGEQAIFVWLEDGMGNKSHLNVARGTLRFDRTPPSGTLLINRGARQTTELQVTLTLQVQDAASGPAEMRFSNDGQTWSPWEPFTTEKANWDLSQFGGNADSGRKTVSAQVRDRAGNVASLSAQIEYIRLQPPLARFTITPQNPRPAQRVTFDASTSSSPNGAITRYAWDFGDGSTQETNQPTVQHTYASEGRYKVRLTVTDAFGMTASAEQELVVQARSDTLRVPQDFSTVEEAVRAAQPGDVIAISAGIYNVNLVLDKPVTLRGVGPQTLLRGQDPSRPVLTVQVGGFQARVEALRLTTQANMTAAAVFVQSGALTIGAATLENAGSMPVLELAGSAQVTLEGTAMAPVRLSSSGTVLRARDQARLMAAHVEFVGGIGLELTGSAEAVVSDSSIATTGAGIAFSGSGNLDLTGVRIEAGGDGLNFSSSGSLTIAGVQVVAGKTALRLRGSAELALDLTGSEFAGGEVGLSLRGAVRVTAFGGAILGGRIGLDVGEDARLVMEGAEVTGDGLNAKVSERARARLQRMKLSGGLAGVLVRDSATLILDGNTITDHAFWGTFVPYPPCLLTSTLTGHTNWVGSVAFSPDRKLLASGSDDWTIKLWDVGTGNLVRTLTGHTSLVRSVAFSPDGELLASGSVDRTIKLWDVGTGNLVRTLTGHTDWVYSVAFSPDGKLLASGSSDRTIKLWDVGTGNLVRTLTGHTDWVNSVAFSPDGKLLASGSSDRTIKLWDVGTGNLVRTLTGHTSSVSSVAFSPDGKLLASGSGDRTIKLWDVGTGNLVRTLTGHTSWVSSVVFSPDGKLLASGSGDQTIKLWNIATGIELLDVALELLSGAAGEFTGVIAGGENVMERNGQRVPERALQAGQGDVCPAELLFLVKPK